MTTRSKTPAEVTPSRRRASTIDFTGLDNPINPRVNEDISFRIRSLLLSRNVQRPPRTPFPSDEHNSVNLEYIDGADTFDFGSAKSVIKSSFREARRLSLSLPEDRMAFFQDNIPSFDGGSTRRPTRAEDLSTLDGAAGQNIEAPQPVSKKKFKFPRLVLQDKKKRDTTIKSCIEISSEIPKDDAAIHETDLTCCPPCDPSDSKPSKYIVGFGEWPYRAVKAEPGDLACFLAGCPPGRINCTRHQPHHRVRRAYSTSIIGRGRNLQEDFKAIANDLARDVSKLGVDVKNFRVPSPLVIGPLVISDKSSKTVSRQQSPPIDNEIPENRKLDGARSQYPTFKRPRSSSAGPSPRSSVTSSDAFPHASISEEVAGKESELQPFSATIITNFSLPGPKVKRSHAARPPSVKQPPLIEDVVLESEMQPDMRHAHVIEFPAIETVLEPFKDESPQPMPDVSQSNGVADSKNTATPLSSSSEIQLADQVPLIPKRLGRTKTSVFSPQNKSGANEVEMGLSEILVQMDVSVEHGEEGDLGDSSDRTPTPEDAADEIAHVKSAKVNDEILPVNSKEAADEIKLVKSAKADDEVLPVNSKEAVDEIELVRSAKAEVEILPVDSRDAVNGIPPVKPEKAEDKPVDSKEAIDGILPENPGATKLENSPKNLDQNPDPDPKLALATAPNPENAAGKGTNPNQAPEDLASPVASHLANLQSAIEFVDSVKERIQEVEHKFEKKAKSLGKHPLLAASRPTSPPPNSKAIPNQSIAEEISGPSFLSKPAPALIDTPKPFSSRQPPVLDADPLNSAYWGFVPAVKEAVQDAVQVAVRNAVHEIVVPPGVKQDMASDAYRKLVADSLSEAAKTADTYLRRASLWNEPASSPRSSEATVISPGLTTVPLDPPTEPENKKGEFKYSIPWKTGSSPRYSAIPSRKSSKNRVLGAKTSRTTSPQKLSPKDSGPRKRSYERVGSRSQGLRSISSVGSLENAGADAKAQNDHDDSQNNTVHWLKGLLSNDAPYQSQLTALPPRIQRGENRSAGRIRAQTVPDISMTELLLVNTPKPVEVLDIPKPPIGHVAPETFTKTINDLENLLNEAIIIARQAADRSDAAKVPGILEDAAKMLKDQRKGLSQESLSRGRNQNRAGARAKMRSDELSSVPSVHESLRSYSGSSASDYSDNEDQLKSNVAPDVNRGKSVTLSSQVEARTSHPSGWPPTGRASSPYPPGSIPMSKESVAVDAPLLSKIPSNDSIENIRTADPRSLPAETGFPSMGQTLKKQNSIGPAQRVSTNFITNEPFRRSTTISAKRESFSKSPRHVSSTRKSQNVEDQLADQETGPLLLSRESDRKFQSEDDPENIKSAVSAGSGPVPLPRGSNTKGQSKNGSENIKSAVFKGSDPVPLPRCSSSSVAVCRKGHSEDEHDVIKAKLSAKSVPSKGEVRSHIKTFRQPPIQPRVSSIALRQQAKEAQSNSRGYQIVPGTTFEWQDVDHERMEQCSKLQSEAPASHHLIVEAQKYSQSQLTSYSHSLDGTLTNTEEMDFSTGYIARDRGSGKPAGGQAQEPIELKDRPDPNLPETGTSRRRKNNHHDLRGKSHVSLKEHKGFSLARSHKKQTIARDWSPGRKRFAAAVACISTALVGILAGIYAGQTPAIQYYIVDFHHYTVLGNVFFFIGLAVPTFLFWPLPLLHGRKPYILGAMSLAMPLLFPQAIAVGQFRSPYVSTYRVGLILSRALMGFCLGFANMNFKSLLTDLFGASLQSENPHQEVVDEFDVRRHGGGMGIWLGLWTWSAMGSIGVGFMVGAVIINNMAPAWGFYISIMIIAAVLFLNILTPEVRRSAYRRSVAEVVKGEAISRRLARGEVKMHMVQTGPKWWGEEFHYGVMLSQKMLRQPGFLVMSLYVAWMYAQIVLIILLLGSLMSKYYKLKSPQVGLAVTCVPVGAMLAIPFQSASLFSRTRYRGNTDDDTFDKKVHWSSHLVRRAIFILVLPFAGMAYTLSSTGPPVPVALPIIFAALIGFLSNLAMAECHGIIMETFDTSDLQPGMTGRPRGRSGDKTASKRTNYSSFPRVAAGFAITQGLGYLFAAVATGVGGSAERQLGAQAATGIMAGILLVLSLLLLGVLARFREVQIIPDSKADEMTQWRNARRASVARQREGADDEDEPWRPVIIGNPTHHTRRMCLLEMGGLTRWSEIRRKNHLVDQQSLEAKHPNRVALEAAKDMIKEAEEQMRHNIRRSLSRGSSRGSRKSNTGGAQPEDGDLGGHREMLSPSGKGSRRHKSIKE